MAGKSKRRFRLKKKKKKSTGASKKKTFKMLKGKRKTSLSITPFSLGKISQVYGYLLHSQEA